MDNIDYQKILWGGSEVLLKPSYLAYLRLKYTLDDLKKIKGKILDAGCGGGGFAKALKYYRNDSKLYGVDISAKAIKYARYDARGVIFGAGDLYKLPYKDNYFDAVVVEDVLEHLDHPQKALKEIGRVLKEGGVFSAFIPVEGSKFSLHFWLKKLGWNAKEKIAGHVQKFKEDDLKFMIRDSGMSVRKKRYITHLLGQIVDIVYFAFLDWTGKKFEVGLEQNLKDKPVLRFFKNTITKLTNLESQVLNFIPGAGVHIKCVKKS